MKEHDLESEKKINKKNRDLDADLDVKSEYLVDDSTESTKTEKKGFISSYIGGILKPITIVKKSAKNIPLVVKNTKERVLFTKKLFSANLNDPEIELIEKDFEALKLKWEFSEEDIEPLKKYYFNYFLSSVIGSLIIITYMFFNIYFDSSFYALFSLFFFLMVTTFISLSNFWRYSVLNNRKFIPFFKWILE